MLRLSKIISGDVRVITAALLVEDIAHYGDLLCRQYCRFHRIFFRVPPVDRYLRNGKAAWLSRDVHGRLFALPGNATSPLLIVKLRFFAVNVNARYLVRLISIDALSGYTLGGN